MMRRSILAAFSVSLLGVSGLAACAAKSTETGTTGGADAAADVVTAADVPAKIEDIGVVPEVAANDTSTGGEIAPDAADAGAKAPCEKGKGCYNGQCCTCFPGACQAGIDNSLSGLANLANGPLQTSVDDGTVNILAEFANATFDGKPFTLNMYTGTLDPSNDGKAAGSTKCDVAAAGCKWQIADASFDPSCKPLIAFSNATLDGKGKLTAGGKDGIFRLTIPIQSFALELLVTSARIEGTATYSADGKTIIGIAGILAGAVPKKALEDAVDKLGDKLPLSPEAIKQILTNVVKNDIDALGADGKPGKDGVLDSASIAIKFEGVAGTVTGVNIKPPPAPPAGADAGGADVGTPTAPPKCETYPTKFDPEIFRLATVGLGENAKPGNGLDVDGICGAPDTTKGEQCPPAL